MTDSQLLNKTAIILLCWCILRKSALKLLFQAPYCSAGSRCGVESSSRVKGKRSPVLFNCVVKVRYGSILRFEMYPCFVLLAAISLQRSKLNCFEGRSRLWLAANTLRKGLLKRASEIQNWLYTNYSSFLAIVSLTKTVLSREKCVVFKSFIEIGWKGLFWKFSRWAFHCSVLQRTFKWIIEVNKVIMCSANVASVDYYKEYYCVSEQ